MFPLLERVKVVPEPAAAAAMAALLTGRIPLRRGMSVVCVLCGGNVDRARLREIL
jgi:threonine dehydratase